MRGNILDASPKGVEGGAVGWTIGEFIEGGDVRAFGAIGEGDVGGGGAEADDGGVVSYFEVEAGVGSGSEEEGGSLGGEVFGGGVGVVRKIGIGSGGGMMVVEFVECLTRIGIFVEDFLHGVSFLVVSWRMEQFDRVGKIWWIGLIVVVVLCKV